MILMSKLASLTACMFAMDLALADPEVLEEYYCNGSEVLNNPSQLGGSCAPSVLFGQSLCGAEFLSIADAAPKAIGLLQGGEQLPVIAGRSEPLLCLHGKRMSRTHGEGLGTCTASLVAKDLIVTAKHCLPIQSNIPIYWYPKFWPIAVPVSAYKYSGQRFKVLPVPIYESSFGQGDLVLMRLAGIVTGIPPLAIKALPKPSSKLKFYGHILGSSLVKVDWSIPLPGVKGLGPSLLKNQVFRGGIFSHEEVASMFCASTDQADGASGGPFTDKATGAVVGVLWGGPKDTNVCGEDPPGECLADDDCLTPVGPDYYGDVATRTDILCMPGVLPDKTRKQLNCIP